MHRLKLFSSFRVEVLGFSVGYYRTLQRLVSRILGLRGGRGFLQCLMKVLFSDGSRVSGRGLGEG